MTWSPVKVLPVFRRAIFPLSSPSEKIPAVILLAFRLGIRSAFNTPLLMLAALIWLKPEPTPVKLVALIAPLTVISFPLLVSRSAPLSVRTTLIA